MDAQPPDAETALSLLNDAKLRNDLLTKQLTTQRAVIAELYEERDAAWAALVRFNDCLSRAIRFMREFDGVSLVQAAQFSADIEEYAGVLAAARNGVKADEK